MWAALPCLCPGRGARPGPGSAAPGEVGTMDASSGPWQGSDPCPQGVRGAGLASPVCPALLTLPWAVPTAHSPCPAPSDSLLLSPFHSSFQCLGLVVFCCFLFFFPKIALLQNLLVVEKLLCLALVWVYLLVSCSEIAWMSLCWQLLVQRGLGHSPGTALGF